MDEQAGSNSESEQTDSAQSPRAGSSETQASNSREQSTGASENQSDSQSSEDSNTQSDKGAGAEGSKSENRYQKLANDNRRLAEENQRLSAREVNDKNVGSAVESVKTQIQSNPDPIFQANARLALQGAEMQQFKEEREFDKAAKKFPQLDADGADYDKDFHDDVWLLRNGSKDTNGNYQISYEEAAKKLQRRDQLIASKAADDAETKIAEKQSVSSGSQKRTTVASNESNREKEALNKLKNDGSVESLRDVLAARRARSGS